MLETIVFREYRYDDNIDDKIKKLEDTLEKNNKDISSLKELAEIYHAYSKNKEAIEIYEKLVSIMPEDYEVLAYLGYLNYEINNLVEAEKNLIKSLEIQPLEPFVLFLLGNVLTRKGNIVEAINYYELAIFLDFDVFTAHVDFGRKYEHMGRHKRALEEYRSAYNMDNTDLGLLEKIDYLEKKLNIK